MMILGRRLYRGIRIDMATLDMRHGQRGDYIINNYFRY